MQNAVIRPAAKSLRAEEGKIMIPMVQIKVTKDEIQSRTPDVVPEIRVDEPTTLGGGPSVSEGTSSGMSRDIQ